MKKIGLITWFTYENYGTYLQWYAMSRILLFLDNKVTTINYLPKKTPPSDIIPDNKKTLYIHYKNKVINRLVNSGHVLSDLSLKKRHENFLKFKSNPVFEFTKKCQTSSDLFSLNDEFDCFISGSDQIWSPLCFDSHYFLDFVEEPQKKIAYAPSIGSYSIENPYIKKQIIELMKSFGSLSIREIAGKNLIKDYCNIEVPVVLDPTLLLKSTDWNAVENKEYKIPEKYILCYFLGKKKSYWKSVQKLSNRLKIPILILPVFNEDFKIKGIIPDDVGPSEFIKLIKNASFVCTDSYHGSIFSIIYRVPFAIFKRFSNNDKRNQNSRIDTLCENFGLVDRIVTYENPLAKVYEQTIDWKFVEKKQTDLCKYSINYLKMAINSATASNKTFTITNTCCGCGACASVCPKEAIIIQQNREGFLHSFINKDKCILCKKCRTVCPFYEKSNIIPITKSNKLYAVKSTNSNVLNVSSSGGIGFELMDYYKKQSSSVIGCVYDSVSMKAYGEISGDKNLTYCDISKFQGSKYIQSDYSKIYKYLDNVGTGIITGLPCQIAAINNYLIIKGRREKFLLVDLICHGVPSQTLWEKYISESKRRFRFSNNPDVKFRNKHLGWVKRFISLSSNGEERIISSKKDLFYAFFLAENCYALSCYDCNYRCTSCADLRIADYWNPDYYKTNPNGLSMCIPVTKEGENVLMELKKTGAIYSSETNINDMYKYQQTANTYIPLERKDLLELFNTNMNLNNIKKEYLGIYIIKNKISWLIRLLKLLYRR